MKNKEIIEKITQMKHYPKVEKLTDEQKRYVVWMFKKVLSLKEAETAKRIDDNWEELVFDLHTRFCKIADEKTHRLCNQFKEAVKEDLKQKIKKEKKK